MKFKLFASCFPVKGLSRSTICDVQRGRIKLIPNSLCDILLEYDGWSKEEVISAEGKEYEKVIKEYYEFLIENEFGFWTKTPQLFPSIDLKWESPTLITNGIVDSNQYSAHNWKEIFRNYDELGCKHLQLRFFDTIELLYLKEQLNFLETSRINSIELILKYSNDIREEELVELGKTVSRISNISIHSSSEYKHIEHKLFDLKFYIDEIDSNSHCGNISKDYFVINQEMFLESLSFNSCLNKKISIDVNGDIKNCPSMQKTFGNIENTSLVDALEKEHFKDTWGIHKEQIDVCKVCEFRHICTDCRAFLGSDNSLEKPKKCSYNPETMKWKDGIPNASLEHIENIQY